MNRSQWLLTIFIVAAVVASSAQAETEEQRLVRISKNLKPITDSRWNEIVGPSGSDAYEISKGDNLWSISKKLFGNPNYWPKVWSINNNGSNGTTGIGNPHIVEPGERLTFVPGSSTRLPRLSAANKMARSENTDSNSATASDDEISPSSNQRKEYDKLPQDAWVRKPLGKEFEYLYDAYGLEKDIKVTIPSRFVSRVPSIANDSKLPYLGEVHSSRRDGVGLGQGDTVFVTSPNQELQVGTTYSILAEPESLSERRSDRTALIYQSLGEIKIIGVKDELYVGVIERSYDVIKRGDRLYPLLPLITDIKPIPSSNPLEALALFSSSHSTQNTAQFHFIHLDRGVEDGVQVGHVFRVYEYFDPATRKKITDADYLIQADAIVVHTTAQFSTAMVIRSRDTFTSGDFGVMLTDVRDLEKQLKGEPIGPDATSEADKELDELDSLDQAVGEGMGKQEEAEIRELENWDKTKDLQTQPNAEPTIPGDATAPLDENEQLPDGSEPNQKRDSDDNLLNQPGEQSPISPELAPGDGTPDNFQQTPGVEPWQQTAPDDKELQKTE